MKLTFQRTLPARAEFVWPYLTVPARMNEWSEARVEALEPGPGGRDDEPGALSDAAGACELFWAVRFSSAVPGVAPVLGAILRPRLERSLTALEGVIARTRAG